MSFKDACAGGGLLFAAASLFMGSFIGEQARPYENVVEPAAEVAFSPSESCFGREGWKNTSTEADHAVVISCTRDGWIVILAPDKSFSHALNPAGNAFEFDPAKVPNW